MDTLFNNHPYISSSKFSADWRATATYVGMVVEYVAMLWSAHHCVHGTVKLACGLANVHYAATPYIAATERFTGRWQLAFDDLGFVFCVTAWPVALSS